MAELRVPLIEEDDVRMALKALRQAEPYPRAFWQLVWIHQWVEERRLGSVSVEGDVALGNALVHMIETNLQEMRRTMGLLYDLPQERQAALDRYKQDFSQENVELEAWSALYYRYVRFDLDLSLDKMADELGISTRNLRRRIDRGIRRLTEAISQQEADLPAEARAHLRLGITCYLADLHWQRGEEAQAQAALVEAYSLADRWALTTLLARIEQHPANRA